MIFSGIAALKFRAMGAIVPPFQSNYIKATLMGTFHLDLDTVAFVYFSFLGGRNGKEWNVTVDESKIDSSVKTQV